MECAKCRTDNPENTKFCGNCGSPLDSTREIYEAPTRTLISSTHKLAIGGTFAARYHIIEELGKGGMGRVYKAMDNQIDEKLALKVLNADVAADEKTRQRFRDELKITRQISHRHICRVYDFNEDEGVSYFTMEYVSGEDLKSLIRRIGQLTPGKAVFVARQVAEGLVEAHRLGVIHRDLKPHNIMIDRDGNVRIMDFGIARVLRKTGLTETGVIMGTPEYMSPEQVEGRETDGRTDIYSLGIILYEMLTGRVPFAGDTPLSVAVKQKTEKPLDPRRINPQITESLDRVILKCLEKSREKRYQDATELLSDLKTIEKAMPSTDKVLPERKTGTAREITVKFKLNKLLVPAVVVVLAVILGYFGLRTISKQDLSLFAADKPSLAVMHFENNTGDTNMEHWRKAISDLLIADLSQSRFLQVLSGERLYDIIAELDLLHSSSYSSKNLRDVAERAGATYVLVGKMTMAGDTVRLNTTLQEAATGEVIGSEQVEGQGEGSLFSLVDDLTARIKTHFKLSAEEIASDIDADVSEITTGSTEASLYYNEALQYQNRAEYDKSIPLFELAVAIDPEFAMAYRGLYVAYGNLGYKNESQRRLEKAFELRDRVSERERHYIEADYYRASEKTFDKAIAAYSQLLELYPDDHIGNNNLGIVYLTLEEFDKAIACFETNVRNRAQGYQSYTNLSSAYISRGLLDKARKINEDFIEYIGDVPQVHANLANIHIMQGKYDEALEEVEKSLTLNPTFYMANAIKGTVMHLRGDSDNAEAEIRKLLETDQPVAHHTAYNVLSGLLLSQGKFTTAESQLREALDLADMLGETEWKVGARLGLAYLFTISGRGDEALLECDQALAIAQESPSQWHRKEAKYTRSLVLAETGDLAEARKAAAELKTMIESGLNQKELRLYYHLSGLIKSKEGNYDEAIQDYTNSQIMMPFRDKMKIMVDADMAEALQLSGDAARAREVYAKIVSDPLSLWDNGYVYAMSHYELGRLFQETGRNQAAKRYYQRFLDLWKNADQGIPQVQDAQKQLAAL